jgi:membrane protease YdiL (CAAX protease family)
VTALAGTVSGLTSFLARATAGPSYPPNEADLRDVRIAGLDLPLRASAGLFAVTALVLADYTRLAMRPPIDLVASFRDTSEGIAAERLVLFGLVPFLIVVAGFRDRPDRYGLRLGDWRWGTALLGVGLVVMAPIILGLSRLPDFAAYYGTGHGGPFAAVLAWNAIELFPSEFLFRGFLLFALLRRIGPLAVLVVQVPFVFAHIGKPELELWSTFIGGTVFAWLNWRTGSIVWSALGHLYVLTLMLVAVGAAT